MQESQPDRPMQPSPEESPPGIQPPEDQPPPAPPDAPFSQYPPFGPPPVTPKRRVLVATLCLGLAVGGGYFMGAQAGGITKADLRACHDALDSAERLFGIAAEGFQFARDGFEAVRRLDIADLSRSASEIKRMADRGAQEAIIYSPYARDCRELVAE